LGGHHVFRVRLGEGLVRGRKGLFTFLGVGLRDLVELGLFFLDVEEGALTVFRLTLRKVEGGTVFIGVQLKFGWLVIGYLSTIN